MENEFYQLIGSIGFPAAMCCALLYYNFKTIHSIDNLTVAVTEFKATLNTLVNIMTTEDK